MSKAFQGYGRSEAELNRREYLLSKQAEKRDRDRKLLSEKWREELRGIGNEMRAAGL